MVTKLELRSQFEAILVDYHPSDHAIAVLQNVKLVLLMGLSASGRNTIIQELLKTEKYNFIVSDTTRLPRANNGKLEQNGVEYYFRNEQDLLEDLKKGEFLEAAIIHNQQVSGISIRELEKIKNCQHIAISDVQTDGIDAILKIKPDAHCIFVLPPSFEVWMNRLNARGHMNKHEKLRRLGSALDELEHIQYNGYAVVVNDQLEKAVQRVRSVVEEGHVLPYYGSKAEIVVEHLRQNIKLILSKS